MTGGLGNRVVVVVGWRWWRNQPAAKRWQRTKIEFWNFNVLNLVHCIFFEIFNILLGFSFNIWVFGILGVD